MKRIVALSVFAILAFPLQGQVTPQIGLNLPVYSSPNWNVPLNQNFTILDNYLGGVNTFPNPLKASITGSAADLSGGALGSVPYQTASGQTSLLGPNTTTSTLFLCEQGTGIIGAAPTWCNGGGSVTSFAAPSGSWPSWLVPTVTNLTTTPSLAVSASAIPNSALANASTTVNGVGCTLGATCTVTAAAGTLTGSTLASGVTGSSLTSVGTINSGTWQGTPIANSYLAHNYTTVNGQVCTLGGSCSIATGTASNLAGGALGAVPYQAGAGSTSFVSPNTTAYTLYLCETGTGSAGAAPAWCSGGGGGTGTVTSVSLSMPSTQFTVTGSPVTSSGGFSVTLNSPTGSGAIVLANTPTLITPNIGAATGTSFVATSFISLSGHLNLTGATPPTISSCGGTTSVVGNDNVFAITTGSGTPVACTATFSAAIQKGICVASGAVDPVQIASISTSAVTFTINEGETKVYAECF